MKLVGVETASVVKRAAHHFGLPTLLCLLGQPQTLISVLCTWQGMGTSCIFSPTAFSLSALETPVSSSLMPLAHAGKCALIGVLWRWVFSFSLVCMVQKILLPARPETH